MKIPMLHQNDISIPTIMNNKFVIRQYYIIFNISKEHYVSLVVIRQSKEHYVSLVYYLIMLFIDSEFTTIKPVYKY